MNLSFRITSRVSLALLVLMAAWAGLFYFIIIEEINDETDDSLEDYSENIIRRALTGEALPAEDNGTNNSYYIEEVTPEYAAQNPAIQYYDETVYIASKKETEPARVLKTIFTDTDDRYYELTVSIPTIEKEDLREAILHWIVFLYLALLFVIIGINWWILHRNFKPLYVLLKWMDNFGVEKKNVELVNPTNVTEFRKLNEAVVRSARRNIETYEQQKSFIGHASHELQTPLAASVNRLEMLAEDPQLTENQLGEILKIKHSLDQLVKLNKTLLLLTKIENNQFPNRKEISVNGLIKKLTEDYSEVYEERHISVSMREEADPKIYMNDALATALFGNLLKNAYIHNRIGGSIDIFVTASRVSIANSGLPETLDTTVIFNRFYRSTEKEGSTGLGLALCKSICNLYKMDIRYEFSDGKHIFTVFF